MTLTVTAYCNVAGLRDLRTTTPPIAPGKDAAIIAAASRPNGRGRLRSAARISRLPTHASTSSVPIAFLGTERWKQQRGRDEREAESSRRLEHGADRDGDGCGDEQAPIRRRDRSRSLGPAPSRAEVELGSREAVRVVAEGVQLDLGHDLDQFGVRESGATAADEFVVRDVAGGSR